MNRHDQRSTQSGGSPPGHAPRSESSAATGPRPRWTFLCEPYVVVPLVNTLASLIYVWGDIGRISAAGALSLLVSCLAGIGLFYLILGMVPPRRVFALPIAALLAVMLAAMHVAQFIYYQVFKSLIPVSVVDYTRQLPRHGVATAHEYLTFWHGAALAAAVVGLTWYFQRTIRRIGGTLTWRRAVIALLPWAILPLAGQRPHLSLDQYALSTLSLSLRGLGRTNVPFVPDRIDLPPLHVEHPINVVFFELESVAPDALQIYNPELPTAPRWTDFIRQHPDEVFVALKHFSNSSASDIAMVLIYTGTAADDPFALHKTAPLLWDYAKSAGYDTSLFMAAALSWGDFDTRYQHHHGHTNLDHIAHAFNAGKPLVHDLSMNDADVMGLLVEYLEGRNWQQPFLTCVSLKMPHFLGQGAKLNGFRFLNDRLPNDRLINYYNAIYHDDQLMVDFIEQMPAEVRRNTVVAVLCDHGEDLYGRGVRLENYHEEIARIPCWFYIPKNVQERLRPDAIENLRHNCRNVATSNLDALPTLLDLMGLAEKEPVADILAGLQGQTLLRKKDPPECIVMLNTNDLRSWDREGFALTMDNGTVRYIYNMGQEGLYDLERDPREEHDLMADPAYATYVERVRQKVKSNPYLLRIAVKYGTM